MRKFIAVFITLLVVSCAYAQTFSFTADTIARYGEAGELIPFHARFESLIDDTQWINYQVDPYDFPDEGWRISICNDSGCFAPGIYSVNNLYQAFEIDTFVFFEVRMTEVGDSGHFSATLTAACHPENPQTIHFTVYKGQSGVMARWSPAPETHNLITSYPNPFNSGTTLQLSIVQEGETTLAIYDLLGREIARLLDGECLSPGRHEVRWTGTNPNGTALPTGVYFAKLTLRDEQRSHRLYLVR
jgi:hypothetical protein